jgi:hypothetical protein
LTAGRTLTVRINDPAVSIGRKCLTSLTALSPLTRRRSLTEGKRGTRGRQDRQESKYSVCHKQLPA